MQSFILIFAIPDTVLESFILHKLIHLFPIVLSLVLANIAVEPPCLRVEIYAIGHSALSGNGGVNHTVIVGVNQHVLETDHWLVENRGVLEKVLKVVPKTFPLQLLICVK